MVAEDAVPVLVLHGGPLSQVNVVLLDDKLHPLSDRLSLGHLFLIDLLVALIQVLVLLFSLFALQSSIDQELIELQWIRLKEAFNFADFAVDSKVFLLVNVLVYLLDHLRSLTVLVLFSNPFHSLIILRIRGFATRLLGLLNEVLGVGLLDVVAPRGQLACIVVSRLRDEH